MRNSSLFRGVSLTRTRGKVPVRIFGDMVDLLWQRQQYDAAIKLEILSNQLSALQPISVICGHSMGHFLKTATTLERVRELHGGAHQPQRSARRLGPGPARAEFDERPDRRVEPLRPAGESA